MAKRKRAPGGGRKPKGEIAGKAAWLSTRITPELRRQLDDAAEKSGRSLSQEVERRLRDSFWSKREQDPFLRALFFLFGQIAKGMPFWPRREVRSDAFAFQAFKVAVTTLLDWLAPPGEITTPEWSEIIWPEDFKEPARSPEGLGRYLAGFAWHQLETAEPPPGDIAAELSSMPEMYAYSQARRDLGVAFNSRLGWNRETWAWWLQEMQKLGLTQSQVRQRKRE
jgi:TraY domain